MRRSPVSSILIWACVATLSLSSAGATTSVPGAPADFGKLQLAFEANVGQAEKDVKFAARGRGYQLLLTPRERIMVLGRSDGHPDAPASERGAVLRFQFDGAAAQARLVATEPLELKTNYIFGGVTSFEILGSPGR